MAGTAGAQPTPAGRAVVWFWHDHFATDLRKVEVPYLMYQQHLTLREHAAGSFAELLCAMAIDPAMLIYLDGTQNAVDALNENFGREVMELFTLGRGNCAEDDVVMERVLLPSGPGLASRRCPESFS